jgi:prepilin peptidase CpaA
MPVQLHLIPLAGFAGFMLTAAYEDLRRLVIPNRLTAALCLLWPFEIAVSWPGAGAVLAALGCAAAVFAAGAVLFARGVIGGGDVKLLASAALWAGPAGTPALLVGTALLGGVLALVLLTPLGPRLAAARSSGPGETSAAAPHAANSVPYGIAIAAAALIVIVPPLLG